MFADLWPSHLQELTEDECRELLATRAVGRIAWTAPDGPVLVPLNHVVDGEDVLVRTSPVTELGRAAQAARGGLPVAYEVDDHDGFHQSGWSVLLRGTAEVEPRAALPVVGATAAEEPQPWAEGTRTLLLRLRPRTLTGRRLLGT